MMREFTSERRKPPLPHQLRVSFGSLPPSLGPAHAAVHTFTSLSSLSSFKTYITQPSQVPAGFSSDSYKPCSLPMARFRISWWSWHSVRLAVASPWITSTRDYLCDPNPVESPFPILLCSKATSSSSKDGQVVGKLSSWFHVLVCPAQIWLINALAGDLGPVLRTCWLTQLINHSKHSRGLTVCGFWRRLFWIIDDCSHWQYRFGVCPGPNGLEDCRMPRDK